jgi:hypothetical protein
LPLAHDTIKAESASITSGNDVCDYFAQLIVWSDRGHIACIPAPTPAPICVESIPLAFLSLVHSLRPTTSTVQQGRPGFEFNGPTVACDVLDGLE